MRQYERIFSAALLLALLAAAHGASRYVDCTAGNDQSGANTCLTPGSGSACKTIAQGVAVSAAGDVVVVSSGPCVERNITVSIAINITGASATLPTTMNCTGDRCFSLNSPSGVATLQNLNLTNGRRPDFGGAVLCARGTCLLQNVYVRGCNSVAGGGLYVATGASATVMGGVFSANTASGTGGGAIGTYGALALLGVTFNANGSPYGGAVYSNPDPATTLVLIKNCVFNANTATGAGNAGALGLVGSTAATIIDCVIADSVAGNGAGVFFASTKPFFMSGTTITRGYLTGSSGRASGIYIELFITPATIINSTISYNQGVVSGTGAGMVMKYGELTMNNTNVIGNVGSAGGGMYLDSIALTMNGGRVANNNAGSCGVGGGVYTLSCVSVTFNGVAFDGNAVPIASGGAVVLNPGALSATFTECSFTRNTAASGAAIFASTPITMIDCVVSDNVGTGNDGAGVHLSSAGASVISGGLFANNFGYGGSSLGSGLLVETSSVTVTDNVMFVNNTATYGGAIYVKPDGALYMDDSTFVGNTATSAGGGLYFEGTGGASRFQASPTATIIFLNNTAGSGAAIYTCYALNFTKASFIGNFASEAGAVIAAYGGTVILNQPILKNNAVFNPAGNNPSIIYSEGGPVNFIINAPTMCGNTQPLVSPSTSIILDETSVATLNQCAGGCVPGPCGVAGAGTCNIVTGTCACNNPYLPYAAYCTTLSDSPLAPGLTPTANSMSVAWNVPQSGAPITNYTLYRSTPDTQHFAVLARPTTNAYTDSGLTRSTSYSYYVAACSPVGCSAVSGTTTKSTLDTVPDAIAAAPTFPNVGGTNALAQWVAPAYVGAGITAYVVRSSTSVSTPMPWPCVVCASAANTNTQVTLSGLNEGTTYYVYIEACNLIGCGPGSPQGNFTTNVSAVPKPPPPPAASSSGTTSDQSAATQTPPSSSGSGAVVGGVVGGLVGALVIAIGVFVAFRIKKKNAGATASPATKPTTASPSPAPIAPGPGAAEVKA